MKKTFILVLSFVMLLLVFISCNQSSANNNTNSKPVTTQKCQHSWKQATCQAPITCSKCGETKGTVGNHKWLGATCMQPQTCSVCGETQGTVGNHNWLEATCTHPRTCTVCRETQGTAKEHSWQPATCQKAKTCTLCLATEGSVLPHNLIKGICSDCGFIDKTSDDYKYGLLKKKADSIAFSCAETVLSTALKNPSTMKVLGEEILDSDDFFRYHIRIHYSAQNNLGGTVTDYAEVLIRVNPKMDGTFYYTYNKTLGINFPIFDDTREEWGWGSKPDDWNLDAADKYENPVEVSLKMILANPSQYEGQYVKIKEQLVVSRNILSDRQFSAMQSTGSGKYNYNNDNRIDVFYRLCDNIDECIMLDADYQKFTVIGEVKMYSNATEAYIEAAIITFE